MTATGYPDQLYVYECRGERLPAEEPSIEGYLGMWAEPPFYYLFFGREVDSEAAAWIDRQPGLAWTGSYRLDYSQWQQAAEGNQRVGPFTIATGFDGAEEAAGELLLRLKPGLVFGSGLHPTTRCCLLAVASLFRSRRIGSVVDFGTGTGILALAALKLGAERAVAIDCNLLAARTARENLRRNGFGDAADLVVAEGLEVLRKPSDLLLMNIEWPSLLGGLPSQPWRRYRFVILSGFLEARLSHVESLLPPGCRIIATEALDGWMALVVEPDAESETPKTE